MIIKETSSKTRVSKVDLVFNKNNSSAVSRLRVGNNKAIGINKVRVVTVIEGRPQMIKTPISSKMHRVVMARQMDATSKESRVMKEDKMMTGVTEEFRNINNGNS